MTLHDVEHFLHFAVIFALALLLVYWMWRNHELVKKAERARKGT